MSKIFRLILLIVALIILILTYCYITRGKPISSVKQVDICKLEQQLTLQSNESALYFYKVEEEVKKDTLYLKIFTKTVSFFRPSEGYEYHINLDPKINIVQILDSAFECNKIGKCYD